MHTVNVTAAAGANGTSLCNVVLRPYPMCVLYGT
jgi:hypothetical protein